MTDRPTDADKPDLLQISLRLKAARYIAGRKAPDGRAVPFPVAELAAHEILQRNGITRNRLEDYEQMKVTEPRPMEMEKVADALDVPAAFLLEPFRRASDDPPRPVSGDDVHDAVQHLSEATAAMRVVARRLGLDIGRRDLQLSAAKDRPRAPVADDSRKTL